MQKKTYMSDYEQNAPANRWKDLLLYALKAAAIAFLAILLLRIGLYTLFPTVFETPLPPSLYETGLFTHRDTLAVDTLEETASTTLPAAGTCQVRMTVDLNSKVLKAGQTYSVKAGDQINISAFSTEAEIHKIGYYSSVNMDIRDIFDNDTVIYLPAFEEGTRIQLFIEAVAANDDGSANATTKTGWQKFILEY